MSNALKKLAGALIDCREEILQLLSSIKAAHPQLKELLDGEVRFRYEDAVYRFYHQSIKVYAVQDLTLTIVEALATLAPGRPLNAEFVRIIEAGTGKSFTSESNDRWLTETRPIVEAFLHARFFLEMAVHYGQALEAPPLMMPRGWGALLHLFNLR